MLKTYAKENAVICSVGIFLCIFVMIHIFKPAFLFNMDGSIREFGVGYKRKTILPLWLFSIVLGIMCYMTVLYYAAT